MSKLVKLSFDILKMILYSFKNYLFINLKYYLINNFYLIVAFFII